MMARNRQILCTTEFLHEYYTDGKCPDLEIAPVTATAKIMEGQWLSIHPFENGFDLSYSLQKQPVPHNPNFKYEKLYFLLSARNPGFFHFTEIDWEEGFILYYSINGVGDLETTPIKLVPQLFNYHFSLTQILQVTIEIKNTDGIAIYNQQLNITEQENEIQIDLRNHPGGLYHIALIQNGIPVLDDNYMLDTSVVGRNTFGIFEIPEIHPADPAPFFRIPFESTRATWKYYIIASKEYPMHMHLLEDKENSVQNNRYSNISFQCSERPVEVALNGERVFLFETGTINSQDEFVPQLIPAFEENKKELSLIKYEYDSNNNSHNHNHHNHNHHNHHNHNNQSFLKKCIKNELWDEAAKKHIIPSNNNIYEEKEFDANGDTLLTNVQNPLINKINKEVFIYL